ncbi:MULTISPECIES: non-homologous end joining protein Ku [Streptomyces]|uniref:Non-homologous end joining protein Ku n=2 Tax=Streptomyces rimosus subsp. rimosus TaxID=132474 RepID=A0A8A1V057_STRR1|nr:MULTISPECIES: Ku protein [Streptomyces]KOG77795.1 DNA repair protein [Kitasatospora aureofaciens]MYT43987.1 Ku protein [Streptomyces sp. SID5471]KEF06708.1 DNA repair protein [Streptomyces rimosus]KOT40092.1 DNA repair protein [Streptomyces rimosus subsp. rimosus]KOT42997.1 DNA repair protein [Streptomyces sp. NRRL WC-3701]
MRSVWNGSISFGLVSIPVKTYSATERTASVSFVRIHAKDGGRIHYRKVCELDGEEVPTEEVGKGYQAADDTIVPITDEDLAKLPLPTTKTLTILAFVGADEIDPLQLDKSYFLGPNGAAATKPYALLRDALEHQEKVAIGKVAMHGRETLAMLRAHDGAIAMHTLLWPDQIRSAHAVAPSEKVEIRENELTLAETLMDSLGELDESELHDDYREAVEELVTAKLEGGEPAAPKAAPRGGKVIDLMAALENSVRAARESRGEGGGAAGEDADEADRASVTPIGSRKTAKKAAAKTASGSGAKKTAARKTSGSAAKKSASGRSAASGGKKSAAGGKKAAAKSSASKSAAKKSTANKSTAKKSGRKASA